MLVKKYPYVKLDSHTAPDGKRNYTDLRASSVPSVTTILSATSDQTFLDEWRKRVGHANAKQIVKEASALGSKVHNAIEYYYLEQEDYMPTGNNHINSLARDMINVMFEQGLTRIDEAWGTEINLAVDGLYAGTSDCIGLVDGIPSIIDFKTAKKIKKKEWITDYFLQGVAYAIAHNQMFETDINQVVILMVDRESKFKEYTINGSEFEEYRDKWAERVSTYYGNC